MKREMPPRKRYRKDKDRIKCKICGKSFHHLGSHLWHKHKIRAKEYKARFGLPYNFALISPKVYRKKVRAFNEHREKYLKNLENSKNFRFQKGKVPKNRYRSAKEVEHYLSTCKKMNKRKLEQCPVCGMKFYHLDSHLYNKHKLIRIK